MNVFTQDASTALLNGLKDLWMSQIIEVSTALAVIQAILYISQY